jgi:glycosyltransferase involved in cell wall biosynthesis
MRRCPWVADFRDPWSRAPWRGNRFRFVTWSTARLERHVVNRADRILFVAQGNRDDFAAAYGADVAQKFHVVPNGCDPAEFQFLTPNSQLPSAEEGMFVLLHAGSLYAGRSPLPLLEALSTAIDRGIVNPATFRLRLLGQVGHASGDLAGTCRRLGLEHVVELVPRIPREQSLQAMCAASGLLLLQPGHTVSVPGKLYEYLATGRPILAIVEEGETADIVRRSGAGVAVAPDNEEAIVEALATFMRMASVGVVPPARELYDGMIRAAETVRILDAVARGDTQTLAANTAVNGSIQRCG